MHGNEVWKCLLWEKWFQKISYFPHTFTGFYSCYFLSFSFELKKEDNRERSKRKNASNTLYCTSWLQLKIPIQDVWRTFQISSREYKEELKDEHKSSPDPFEESGWDFLLEELWIRRQTILNGRQNTTHRIWWTSVSWENLFPWNRRWVIEESCHFSLTLTLSWCTYLLEPKTSRVQRVDTRAEKMAKIGRNWNFTVCWRHKWQ